MVQIILNLEVCLMMYLEECVKAQLRLICALHFEVTLLCTFGKLVGDKKTEVKRAP